jgi:sporulation protein YlmC with PRC-barrel domain
MVATVQAAPDARETSRLISAEKVGGTPVENPRGESLGHINDVMIDKISGQVVYAVLKYGSFLGLGGDRFAVPWDILKYNTARNAYVIDFPQDRLAKAPSFTEDRWPDMNDRSWNQSVHDYYGSRANWYY